MSLQHVLERYLGSCVRIALRRAQPLVIGVAGSVGKTSTKAAIGVALGADEPGSSVIVTPKNYNNELGVPLTVFGCVAPHRSPVRWAYLLAKATLTAVGLLRLRGKTYVLELGTDKPGDLPYLMAIVRPTVGVLTAIGPEHTEFFGTVENVAKEEASIVRTLPSGGVAIVNADDLIALNVSEKIAARRLTFGTAESSNVRLESVSVQLDEEAPESSGLRLAVSVNGVSRAFDLTGTVGRPQALAATAALAVAHATNGDADVAIARLGEGFHGMPGRMRLLRGIRRTWLIDDSYNSSPLAALSAIHDLASFPVEVEGRRIAALGDMLELGALSEDAHVQVGRAAASCGVDIMVACGTLAHVVAQAAIGAGMPEDRVFTFAKSADAGLFIQDRMREHDVVLVKGSQGVRMERITKELMDHPERAEQLLVRHTEDWLKRE